MNTELVTVSFSQILIGSSIDDLRNTPLFIGRAKQISMAPDTDKGRSYFFRDLITGVSLRIDAAQTFCLRGPEGYFSGEILAQHMEIVKGKIDIWHQDSRRSFYCHACADTGFCFGWFIDNENSLSYRVLDPGKL